jgi:hypothetical protein
MLLIIIPAEWEDVRRIAAKERKRISAALTRLHMDSEGNKINSEQKENTSHGTRSFTDKKFCEMSQCTVSSDNSDYKWDKAVSFWLLRAALLKNLAVPWSNKQTTITTINCETSQFSLKLKERHVTILFVARWS